jgi:hypothetical protein
LLLALHHGGQGLIVRVIPSEQVKEAMAHQPAQLPEQPMAMLDGLTPCCRH